MTQFNISKENGSRFLVINKYSEDYVLKKAEENRPICASYIPIFSRKTSSYWGTRYG